MSRLFFVHGVITDKFIAVKRALTLQDKNHFVWQDCVINKRSMENVTMPHVRPVTEGS
jgi:hypothetical protein